MDQRWDGMVFMTFKEFSLYIKIVLAIIVIKNEGSNFLQLYYQHFGEGTCELFHLIWLHLDQAIFLFDYLFHFNYFGLYVLHLIQKAIAAFIFYETKVPLKHEYIFQVIPLTTCTLLNLIGLQLLC